MHTHTHTYIYTYTYRHTYNTYKHTHIYTYLKLSVICVEIPHTQIQHDMATSQLNPNKSHVTGFHITQSTRAGNPRTLSSKNVNKNGLK